MGQGNESAAIVRQSSVLEGTFLVLRYMKSKFE